MTFDSLRREHILQAIREAGAVGPKAFREKYGYGKATKYLVAHDGSAYDSKAILGVAEKFATGSALQHDDFSGGEQGVLSVLRRLGFSIVRSRNPDWKWDEIVLACDLLVSNNWRGLSANDPRVVDLSVLLGNLDLHGPEERGIDFRNPNGVAMKTANLATEHPEYTGKPTNGGRHDRAVTLAFIEDPVGMANIANRIRVEGTSGSSGVDFPDPDLEGADEGRLLERHHLRYERDRGLRARKITATQKDGQPIACEACGFDFAYTYGRHGEDYIEVHHLVPLHTTGQTRNTLRDLALLCSNCHRMIHRRTPWLRFEELVALLRGAPSGGFSDSPSFHISEPR
jgi:5-methylcytosine-specific restriction protein A